MLVPEIEIIVSAGGAELLRKTVRPGDYVIGREAGCEVRVEVEMVSRRHAQLTVNYDHALIEDLGSSNGTFVNGKAVTEATRLWPNQKIQVGAATIELRRVKTLPLPDVSLAPSAAAVQRLLPEELLRGKKYDIGGVVAQGGMGAILDAREAATERNVAMKVMLDGSSPDDLTRFVAEAKVTAQLEHPNIVPVHELSVDENDQVFYTMKFVRGITLKKVFELMAGGNEATLAKYPLGALLTIFQKVCDAVAFAHSKGVIHRDLKPENIMLGDFGEVLLMDWGLAKVLEKRQTPNAKLQTPNEITRSAIHTVAEVTGSTMSGTIMGTPQYMAPEQARGEIETLDARADIYALGGILYHLLALRPAVTGDDAQAIVEKVARGEIAPLQGEGAPSPRVSGNGGRGRPHSLRIPDSLAAVVRKAMALEKTQRYASVADLQADIAAFQNGFATSAEQAGLAKQLVLLIKRNKGIFSTAATAWLLITALAVWFVLNLRVKERRAVAGEQSAIAEADRATKAEAVAVQEKESTRQALAKSALALAESARREGNGLEMQAALGDVPEDLRDSTWHYLLDQADTSIARVRTDTNQIESVAAHPRQAGVFAVAGSNNKVSLIEVRTGVRLLNFVPSFPPKTSGNKYRIAFSPDGERIAVGRDQDGGIVIHSARDGKKVLAWPTSRTVKLEFSPDGKLLLQIEDGGQRLNVWDTSSGQLAWAYVPSSTGTTLGTFTPDGQQILTYAYGNGLRVVNAQDGTLIRTFKIEHNLIRALAMAPNGTAASADTSGFVTRFDLRDGRVLSEFRADDKRVVFLAFTPTGEHLVTAVTQPDGRQTLQVWQASTGERVLALLGGSGEIRGMSLHPFSGELLVGGPNARVWSLTGTPAKWLIPPYASSDSIVFWGSDDVLFATNRLQKLQVGSPAVLWKPGGRAKDIWPSVSADGRFAAVGLPDEKGIILLRNPGPVPEEVTTFKPARASRGVRLSPMGDRLATIAYGSSEFELIETATGTQPVKLDRKDMLRFRDLGWLSGGQRLVGLVTAKSLRGSPASEEWVVLWDAATGKILQTVTNRTPMDVLAVAPDGLRFAEAGADKMVRIRDAETLAVQQEFRAHDGPITALAWHPTKPILVTGSTDLSIKLWNLDTRRRLEELRGPLTAPSALAFSPSGQRLGCAVPLEPTLIWEPPSLNEQPAAKEAAGGWEDLLAPFTPAAVKQTGHGWRMDNGVLSSLDKGYATLPLPGKLSGSYQVRVKLRQLTAKQVFHLILPVADQMVGFDLDGKPADGYYTGLSRVNGKMGKDLPGTVHGKQVQDSEPHDLEVTVRLDGTNATITTTLDGQPLYEWSGPIAALSEYPVWITPPGTLALGALAADWVVYEVKVKRL